MTSWTTSSDNLQQLIAVERERRRRRQTLHVLDWQPLPGPQTQALRSPANVIGYGGAGGGGKTDLLLGAAGTYHYRSIIFRRVFPSVRGIIERSREIFARGQQHAKDSYNESLHLWRLADGRTIEFASLQYDADKRKYQGRAYDLHGFDELTEFTEDLFRFVTAWNRTARTDVQPRVICTFNPPHDDDGMWVISYFAPWLDPDYSGVRAMPGEVRWFGIVDGEEREVEAGTPRARSRTFIPASLTDNPYLMQTGYADTVAMLPEPLRSILRGDFTAGRTDDPWRVLPAAWVDAARGRWADVPPAGPLATIGVDVARGGKDQTILARRFGQWYAPLDVHPGSSTPNGPAVAALVIGQLQDDATAVVDVIGVGGSVVDSLEDAGVTVVAFNASSGSDATDRSGKLRFGNKRAEMWWRFREALDPDHGDALALPPDPQLRQELCAPRFFVRSGRIWVESKDDVRVRIGRSTDRADAVLMAHQEQKVWVW